MATRKLSFGGLNLAIVADRRGISIAMTYDGRWWSRLVGMVQARRVAGSAAEVTNDPDRIPGLSENSTGAATRAADTSAQSGLRREVDNTYWYHTFDFGNGVITPGQFDHGAIIYRYCLPPALAGKYAPGLDVLGSRSHMEYRGGREDVSWWSNGLSALANMIRDAGFSRVERLTTFRYGQRGLPENMHHAVFKAYR